jgi:hypothetical protein
MRLFCTTTFKNSLKDCCADHPSLSQSVDVFIKVAMKLGRLVWNKDLTMVTGLRNSVHMPIMKLRLRTSDAGPGTKYRLIFAKNASTLILIDIYPKNEQEKTPLNVVNLFMSNIPKDCDDPGELFIELRNGSCKGLVRSA